MADDDKDLKEEEDGVKDSGALSDSVLDAFEETAPADPLLVDEEELPIEDGDEDADELDYNPAEW